MLSDVPGISEEEKRRLLHCVVIGGGPTGVEFSGEISDFIIGDVHQRYSHVKDYICVTLIEANEILSSFDVRLRTYATKQLTKVLIPIPKPTGFTGADPYKISSRSLLNYITMPLRKSRSSAIEKALSPEEQQAKHAGQGFCPEQGCPQESQVL
ncbi:internal alternative NAD(P)H-ubiquinone oxidoreductase A1, mitochondrial-like [Phoenix dactylifera]|uniref:Internal alternative NAD(P)H-ubiquinone oxidoreductase A1, mitochondrial-like n=1 Tax=Phoenix dactylifera TaxID=42345 RepID=A0A8B8ZBY7_PHODC|nr:internal alternative NAD(P)H-ubiquinone oxidoreductase A1, mitochondrial-like [Phoenix dactylifera]